MQSKVKITLDFDGEMREYLISRVEAKEIEMLIQTGIPKRLIRSVVRIGKNLSLKKKTKKSRIVGESRSGSLYNAIKYLKENGAIAEKDGKIVVCDDSKLTAIVKNLEGLLKGDRNRKESYPD